MVKEVRFEEVWRELESKKYFQKTSKKYFQKAITWKIFETYSSFIRNSLLQEKFNFCSSRVFFAGKTRS